MYPSNTQLLAIVCLLIVTNQATETESMDSISGSNITEGSSSPTNASHNFGTQDTPETSIELLPVAPIVEVVASAMDEDGPSENDLVDETHETAGDDTCETDDNPEGEVDGDEDDDNDDYDGEVAIFDEPELAM